MVSRLSNRDELCCLFFLRQHIFKDFIFTDCSITLNEVLKIRLTSIIFDMKLHRNLGIFLCELEFLTMMYLLL